MAQPTKFTQALADEIVTRLAGGEPLAVICRSSSRMPTDTTVRAWASSRPDLANAIAQAREAGYDTIAWSTRETARGRGDSTDDPQRDKLIIDTDLKLLSKWDPNRYGDKQFIEHSGSITFKDASDEDLIAELFELARTGHLALPPGYKLVELDAEEDFSDLA